MILAVDGQEVRSYEDMLAAQAIHLRAGGMLAGLDEAGREEAWEEIERELGRFEGPDGFTGPCELVVAAGTR